MNRTLALLGLLLAASLATGCSQKNPAQTAIDAAESALAAVSEPAQKYIPQQYAEVKAVLDAARKDFSEGDYVRAIEGVKDIPDKARALGEAAAAARETLHAQLTVDWTRLQGELPGKLSGLESRLAELDKARRLPEGVTRDTLTRFAAGAGVARTAWDEASAAFGADNLEGAVARALESESLTNELMIALGMAPAPAAD